jgi:hypothetical protein
MVGESSGCLDQSSSVTKIPLARTHFDINHFSVSTEPSYRIVGEVVREKAGSAADLLRRWS